MFAWLKNKLKGPVVKLAVIVTAVGLAAVVGMVYGVSVAPVIGAIHLTVCLF